MYVDVKYMCTGIITFSWERTSVYLMWCTTDKGFLRSYYSSVDFASSQVSSINHNLFHLHREPRFCLPSGRLAVNGSQTTATSQVCH